MSTERRINFLSRSLPFPTDPTFREYRRVYELTGISADDVMLGQAGVWMLPILAIVALMRDNPGITHEQLDRVLDLNPGEITLEGDFEIEGEADADPEVAEVPAETESASTGTESTPEIPEKSGSPA